MTIEEFRAAMAGERPGREMEPALAALWWDAKGDWRRAHAEVDALDTREAMAVHAYLHRKEGDAGNAGYWYRRAGVPAEQGPLEAEWEKLVRARLGG